MKFLIEGRKEDLLKKYMGEYDVQLLDAVLNDEFIKRTNYKYADWILKNLEFSNTPHALEVLQLVKDFDRISKNLEKKDINQYPDVAELGGVLKSYTSKSQEKKIDSDAKKIYEDSRVLIVKPTTHRASCKYGAGTKWCTTQSSPGYFDKYTTGGGQLYYVLVKDIDSSNKFYKMALHKTKYENTWYDSQDNVMPPREVEMIVIGIGKKGFQKIEEDFKNSVRSKSEEILSQLFNIDFEVEYKLKNFSKTGKDLTFKLSNPVSSESGHGEVWLDVKFDGKSIEQGLLAFTFDQENLDQEINQLFVDVGYWPNDDFEPVLDNWNSLYNISLTTALPLNKESLPQKFYEEMLKKVIQLTIRDNDLLKYVTGGKTFWYPARSSYGFTFKENKGLINKLINYIDSGKKGSALDFLIDSKIIKPVEQNGEKIYVNKNGVRIQPKGYFSSFFASAILAKIISYEKQGRRHILTKGENFEKFKEGNLKPTDKYKPL
jgi:hypothetical protein